MSRAFGKLGGGSWVAAVGALTVVAFVLRAVLLRDSLFGDELFMYRIVHNQSVGDVMSVVRHTEKTPPLFFYLVGASAKLGGSTVWFRLPSLAFAVGLVPLTYVLGLRTVGRAAGLAGAAIVALDPFTIFYGTEGRAYSALAFLAALSTLCLLQALDTNRRRWWVAYVVAVVAVVYTHYMGVFVLVAQVAWAAWTRRERIRQLLIANAFVLLAYVPWIPSYLLQQSHSDKEARGIARFAPASVERLGEINVKALLGHPLVELPELPGRPAFIAAMVVVIVAAVVAATRAWRHRRQGPGLSSPIALVLLLAVATPAGVGLVSLRPDMSFMLPRNLSPSLVALALLVGWLLTSLGRRASIPAIAVMFVVLVIGAADSLEDSNRRPPFRSVAHLLDAEARPGDPIIQESFLPPTGAPDDVLLINFRHPHPLFRGSAGERQAWALGRRGARVFLVLPLPGIYKSVPHLGRRNGPGKRFVLISERRYTGFWDILVGTYALG